MPDDNPPLLENFPSSTNRTPRLTVMSGLSMANSRKALSALRRHAEPAQGHFNGTAAPVGGAASISITSLVVPVLAVVDSSQEIVDDKVGHRRAESFTGILVGAEMLTREDAAGAGLV